MVVKNVAAFRSRYGNGPRVVGTFAGALGNDGQLTIVHDARNRLLSSFHYRDSDDWPNRADGGGATLEVIEPAGDLNDPDNWRSSREYGGTPGAAGAGPLPGVVVNEVLTNTDAPAVDSIELFNPTLQAVNLGGWYLSDTAANYRAYRIPDGTTIAAGGYLLFNETTLGFALDGEGDDVWLLQADPSSRRLTRFVDRVEFEAAPTGESWGRWPNGAPFAALYPMASATPGAANSGPRAGPVVINEVMYAPGAGGTEFVELRNLTGADVPLDDWRFTAGIDFEFPAGAVIPADGYLLLVADDPDAFRAAYGIPGTVPVLGPYAIGGFLNVLDNAGERLTLSRPGDGDVMYEVGRVRYGNAAPWAAANETGASLAKRASAGWGDAAANWDAEPGGGSPGRDNFGGAPQRRRARPPRLLQQQRRRRPRRRRRLLRRLRRRFRQAGPGRQRPRLCGQRHQLQPRHQRRHDRRRRPAAGGHAHRRRLPGQHRQRRLLEQRARTDVGDRPPRRWRRWRRPRHAAVR